MHHRFVRSAENIAIVSESVIEDQNVSIPRRSQDLGLPYGTLSHILLLDPHLHLYKAQLTQQLKPADHSQHYRRVEWVLKQQAVDGNFSNKVFFSDKHISHSVGMLINKIVVFCVLRILK